MNCIEIKNLTKQYILKSAKATSIKEFILKGIFLQSQSTIINALDNISFNLKKGQTIGIIGGNGSGKSTLLKIIAGITEPTSGEVIVNGNIAQLLELGAGFHPELTGLENLYLNGTILGIPTSELDKKKDEIFRFAELEKFIHTPVKHYSSGMYVRLGFSIAINLDPDILLIDEVLSVGDEYFQIRSFEKIAEFKKMGKSIIFVTHNLDQAETICDEIIWLDKGKIAFRDYADKVVEAYLEKFYETKLQEKPQAYSQDQEVVYMTSRLGSGKALIERVRFINRNGQTQRKFRTGDFFGVEITYSAQEKIDSIDCRVGFATEDGKGITIISAADQNQPFPTPPPQKGKIIISFENLMLEPGKYLFTPAISPLNDLENPYDLLLRFYTFIVESDHISTLSPSVKVPVNFDIYNENV